MTINIETPTTDEPVTALEDSLTDVPDNIETAKTVEETKLSRLSIYVLSFLTIAALGVIAGIIHTASFMFTHNKTVVDAANLTIATHYPVVNIFALTASIVTVILLLLSMAFVIYKLSSKAPSELVSFFEGFLALASLVTLFSSLFSVLTVGMSNVNIEDNSVPDDERVAMVSSVLGEDYNRARFNEGSIYVNSEGKEAYKFIQSIEGRTVTWKFTKTSE
jgi:hypothetical protein